MPSAAVARITADYDSRGPFGGWHLSLSPCDVYAVHRALSVSAGGHRPSGVAMFQLPNGRDCSKSTAFAKFRSKKSRTKTAPRIPGQGGPENSRVLAQRHLRNHHPHVQTRRIEKFGPSPFRTVVNASGCIRPVRHPTQNYFRGQKHVLRRWQFGQIFTFLDRRIRAALCRICPRVLNYSRSAFGFALAFLKDSETASLRISVSRSTDNHVRHSHVAGSVCSATLKTIVTMS